MIGFKNIQVKKQGKLVLDIESWSIEKGDQWAIVGASGSGKTTLTEVIMHTVHFSGSLTFGNDAKKVLVKQQHQFKNKSNLNEFYYQQRYQSTDNEDAQTVQETLEPYAHHPRYSFYLDLLKVAPLLEKQLILLSNGENKRLQLLKALLLDPQFLILDQPFIGLDIATRATLNETLTNITQNEIQVLVITTPEHLPSCITHVGVLYNGKFVEKGAKGAIKFQSPTIKVSNDLWEHYSELVKPIATEFSNAIKMDRVTIQYGNNTILKNVSWTVEAGSKWLLKGENGAGKSTLLSLITADNPQAYANRIELFDKKKGSGESIWDIKKKIGYVSPELHLHFPQVQSVREVIGSGLFDTIGLFRPLSDEQELLVTKWIKLFNLLENRLHLLQRLPLGKQRLTLLARALIKNPPLLVLDEPCQGMDHEQTQFFLSIIDTIAAHTSTTIIYVSHVLEQTPSCIERTAVIEKGELMVLD